MQLLYDGFLVNKMKKNQCVLSLINTFGRFRAIS